MSDEVIIASGIATLLNTGVVLKLYAYVRRIDNLCALHAKNHPEDSGLLDGD